MASIAPLIDRSPTPANVLELPLPTFGPNGKNRRFIPRVNARFIARTRDEGQSFTGVDLSFGGMMCTAAEPVWPGNVLELDVILPGEHRPLAVRGRVAELVAFRGKVAMRIRFEGLSLTERKRIASWMAHRDSV